MTVSTSFLKKVSAGSGLYFGSFLVMHLVNHYSIFFGLERSKKSMILFRKVYQNPIFEFGLIIALMAHYASNTMIYIRRSKIATTGSNKKSDDAPEPSSDHSSLHHRGEIELKAHRYTGYFLSLSVLGHVAATRIFPMIVLADPTQYDHTFIAFAQQKVFGPLFGLYYVVFGMAGGWHLLYGTRSAINTLFYDKSVTRMAFPIYLKAFAGMNHLLIINAALTLGGAYYVIDLDTKKELYHALYSYIKSDLK